MKTKITVLLLILITATSCMVGGFGIQGNGDVISEDRNISSDFTAIKVSQGIQVYLTQGNNVDLSVEADENIMDLLVTEVEGDVLKIYFDKNVNRATKNVYLTAVDINNIKTSSGAHVKGKGVIKTTSLTLNSSSGSGLNLEINADNVDCNTSSGANMKLSGTTQTFDGNASSGSHIKANNLKSEISKSDVSSGASIRVHASEKITASASSGGSIDFYGNPKTVSKSKSSGGSISKN
ncbi:MAG: DUF2807 domain-containing protein [Flavobacteriaceae bacterium]|nr:DUF2807 domain-containing protein [Flavobacteriaceae bacterium]